MKSYSKYSNTATATTNPSAPTGLSSSFVIDTISGQLDWTDNTSGIAQYEIWSAVNGGTSALVGTTIAGAITYSDTTCKQNASIVYKIRAKSGSSYSAFVSASALVTPLCWKTNQATQTQIKLNSFIVDTGKTVVIDWGDTNTENLTGTSTNKTHDYTSTGQYNISLSGDVNWITTFYMSGQSKLYGDITNWLLPSLLAMFDLNSNAMTGSCPNIAGNTVINRYWVWGNLMAGVITHINDCTALTSFSVGLNYLTGDIGEFTNCGNLSLYEAANCYLSGTVPSIAGAPKLATLKVHTDQKTKGLNALSSSNIVNLNSDYLIELNVEGNSFNKTNLASLLSAVKTWFVTHAPTRNFKLGLQSWEGSMSYIEGGETNQDIIDLKAAFTSAGKTLTLTYNDTEANIFLKGKVLFTTDDSFLTHYSYVLPIFRARNKLATNYITTGQIGTGGEYMSWAQVQSLFSAGFDIQGHGDFHEDYTGLSEVQLLAVLDSCASKLVAHDITSPLHEAYPGGAYTANVKTYVAERRLTGRKIETMSSLNTFTAIYQNSDKFIIDAMSVDIMDATNILRFKRLIDWAANEKVAVMFYIHKVGDTDGVALTVNHVYLEELLDYACSSDVNIITISQLYSLLD